MRTMTGSCAPSVKTLAPHAEWQTLIWSPLVACRRMKYQESAVLKPMGAPSKKVVENSICSREREMTLADEKKSQKE